MPIDPIFSFIEATVRKKTTLARQKRFLLALNRRGFTGRSIAAFVRALTAQMPAALSMPGAIDICGTGGSGLPRINTSTISAFILAACGVPIAKHGNRAAGGRCGSFDLLERLSLTLHLPAHNLEAAFRKEGLAFIFAPDFHPAMKLFAPARAAVGVKTVFNLLGPLLNPACPDAQIIGVSDSRDMRPMIDAARLLGKKHVAVVHGADGLDEITLTGETRVMELLNGRVRSYTISPADFGLAPVPFEAIASAIPERNVAIAESILAGRCCTAHRDLVLMNAAFVLKFAGKVNTFREGMVLAASAVDSGSAAGKLAAQRRLSHIPHCLSDILDHKKKEVAQFKRSLPLGRLIPLLKKSDRDFKKAIAGKETLHVIAEIKRASPSAAAIYAGSDFSPGKIARAYERAGADAVSVLTEPAYFKGQMEFLADVRRHTRKIPILMKDFVIDPYQVYLARYYGADAVLLIASLLDQKMLERCLKIARGLGMHALVEAHTKEEVQKVCETSAAILGINNRDLATFEVNSKHVLSLLPRVPADRIVVAESGYDAGNIFYVHGLCDAALVGTSLMRSSDISGKIAKLKCPPRLFKICGVTTDETALFCEKNRVPMVGFNFVNKSRRFATLEQARMLRKTLRYPLVVGVFQDQPLEEVNRIAQALSLDYVQLSGHESPDFCRGVQFPVIKTLFADESVSEPLLRSYDAVVAYYIIDGCTPGSGQSYDYSQVNRFDMRRPFFVAGGVTAENVRSVLAQVPRALGVDVATGVETDGKKDLLKMAQLTRFFL